VKQLLVWASAVGDRVNPVAVKEFRQAVQSRWVITVLMLFLIVNLCVIGGYLMLSPDAETSVEGGRSIFMFMLGFLLVTCIGFVPAYTGIRLSLERNDANIDLFFVTTITPGAIVRGKYLTAMALTLLIFSVCMPFITLTYLLRGIDLPTIFSILAVGFIVCAAANAIGVFVGAVSGSWLIRGIADAGAFFVLFYMTIGTIGMAESAVMFGRGIFFGGPSIWATLGSWLLTEVLGIGLMYVLAVALLSPKPSNRMLIPRLYLMASWAISAIVVLCWSVSVSNLWPLIGWTIMCGVTFIVLTVAALGERDSWSARVRRTIPTNTAKRSVAFVLFTGSAGGIAWCSLMFVATIGVAWLGKTFLDPWIGPRSGFSVPINELATVCLNLSITFGYVLCYCLTIAFFRSNVLKNAPTANLSVLAAFFGVAVCLVPYLTAFFVNRNWWHVLPWYLLGSPMVLGMGNEPAQALAGPIVIAWLALALLLASPWAAGQWRRFTPYQTEPTDETG
jgi:hypothetical protein